MRFDLWWVWEAFCVLSLQRSISNGPNPISLSDLNGYVKLKGIYKDDDIDFLISAILTLDDLWLKDYHEKAEKAKAQEKQKSRKQPRRSRA